MKTILITLAFAAAACAQPALAPPQIGFLLDGAGSLRPLYGIAGNFVLGDSAADGVVSAAFSGTFAVLKTDSALIVTDPAGHALTTTGTPVGPAAFAFTKAGIPAFAYLPQSNLLLMWNATGFQTVVFDCGAFPAGAVQSISAPDPAHVAFFVQQSDGLWDVRVLLATGEVDSQTALPGVTAPALALASGDVLYGDANGIVLRGTAASETHLAATLPANFSLQQMGDGWVQIRDLEGGAQFAVRVTPGREGFYALPEVNQ
jgi:hypothetical protein